MVLGTILNILHVQIAVLSLYILLVEPEKYRSTIKYIILLLLSIPLHWKFFDNRCIITILTEKCGSLNDSETEKCAFSEKYLRWLYKPIINSIDGIEWNDDGIDKMNYGTWIIVFIAIWYYIFFIYCKKTVKKIEL